MIAAKRRPGKRARPTPDTHTHLLSWLEAHPLISISGLERAAHIPDQILSRAIRGLAKLPARHYPHILKVLADYGYEVPQRNP